MKKTFNLSIALIFLAVFTTSAWAVVDDSTVQAIQDEVTVTKNKTEDNDHKIGNNINKLDDHDQKIRNLEGGLPAEVAARIAGDAALQLQISNIQLTPGPMGPQGPQGDVGPMGPAGPAGAVGPQGPAGADGVAGPAGPQGPQGDVGPMGPAGPAGADGVAGPAGADGVAGPAGPQGPIGLTGPQGPAGVDGVAGPIGPQGVAGANGADGLSAYELWLMNGNTGTEADFLASLVGPQGPAGATGAGGTDVTQADILSKIAEPNAGVQLNLTADGRIGVGTTNPLAQVHAVDSKGTSTPSTYRGILSAEHNDGVHAPLMIFKKSRGTESTPTSVQKDDYIGVFQAFAYDGSSYNLPVAQFGFRVDGDVSSKTIPTGFFIETGAPARTERLRISSTGNVGIGTPTPTQKFEVNGGIRINTSATRPVCDANARGTFWFSQDTADDRMEVCARINGIMTWKALW